MDKLDKVGAEAVLADIGALLGGAIPKDLSDFVQSGEADLDFLKTVAPEPWPACSRSATPWPRPQTPTAPSHLATLVRGLDYLHGPVFEFRYPGLSGSIGGAAATTLTEKFGGQKPGLRPLHRLRAPHARLGGGWRAEGLGPDACLTVFSEELCLRL